MTTGQMLFYGGVGLMVLTILTAIVFAATKPRYVPGKVEAADASPAPKQQKGTAGKNAASPKLTAQKAENGTQKLDDLFEQLDAEATELLGDDIHQKKGDKTQLLMDDRTQLLEEAKMELLENERTQLLEDEKTQLL